jgi:uncharacterized protein
MPTSYFPDRVAALISDVTKTSTAPPDKHFLEVLEKLGAIAGIEPHTEPEFRFNEFEVSVGMAGSRRGTRNMLESIASMSLSIAPSVVAYIPFGDDDAVLITRYAACPGERLARIETTTGPLQEAAGARFRADMQKLVDRGLVHPYVRGPYHWLISSETGTLVLDSWYALRECSEAEGIEMMGKVDGFLARRRQASPSPRPHTSSTQVENQMTTTKNRIQEVFGCPRVLLPVIHPVNTDTAMESVRVAKEAGVRGIFLINQGMSTEQVLELVMVVRGQYPDLWVGVNLLGVRPARVLEWGLDACEGRLDGIWADNANIEEDAAEQPMAQALLAERRAHGWNGLYFGGVAFKYQREIAPAKLGRAAAVALPYMDVICTSGPGTGQAADPQKVIAMRAGLGDTGALALASGVAEANVASYLPYVDAYLVGTGIEHAFGVLDPARVAGLHRAIMAYRPQ